jgi:hypothetical protein
LTNLLRATWLRFYLYWLKRQSLELVSRLGRRKEGRLSLSPDSTRTGSVWLLIERFGKANDEALQHQRGFELNTLLSVGPLDEPSKNEPCALANHPNTRSDIPPQTHCSQFSQLDSTRLPSSSWCS